MNNGGLARFAVQTFWIATGMLRARYASTRLGLVWAIAQPALMFVVFWFVSVYGLRMRAPTGVPFFAYLFGGLLPWITFSNAVNDGMGALRANRHLVIQMDFPLIIVPLAAVVSNLFVHLPLLAVVVGILMANGIFPDLGILVLPVYFLGLGAFAAALALTLSVLSVRMPDVGQAVSVLLLLLFWFTPIVWPAANLPPSILTFVQLNPLFWVVGGYRAALLGMPPPGEGLYAIYILAVLLLMMAIGIWIFRRLRFRLGDYL